MGNRKKFIGCLFLFVRTKLKGKTSLVGDTVTELNKGNIGLRIPEIVSEGIYPYTEFQNCIWNFLLMGEQNAAFIYKKKGNEELKIYKISFSSLWA